MSLLNVLGRLCFVAFFAMSALNKFQDLEGSVEAAKSGNWHGIEIPDEQLPYLVAAAGALEAMGALAILFGGMWCGGWMIILFLAGVTPIMHWPLKQVNGVDTLDIPTLVHFMKNLTILGGALMIAHPGTVAAAPKKKSKQA
ncbi:unnamed protein product [Symbiodinium sp. KB8]|nr:unnamed protein product [Symbiodinium sp. KB8]